MRQIGLGGCTRDIEVRDLGPEALEGPPGFLDPKFLCVELGPQCLLQVIGDAHLLFQLVEGAQIRIEPGL